MKPGASPFLFLERKCSEERNWETVNRKRRTKMENKTVYTFKKSESEEVRVSLGTFKEKVYLNVRVWFFSQRDGEFKPTKKGITLGTEFIAELKTALKKAGEEVGLPAEASL